MPKISVEFFPPRTTEIQDRIDVCLKEFARFKPNYYSVTFGAGGSNTSQTEEALQHIHDLSGVPVTPHLTCVGLSKGEIFTLMKKYQSMGINRIVALRGDLPEGHNDLGELKYASDLVNFIRAEFGDYFHISVAAYPECHPESPSRETDFQYFKHKIECGANEAITQYFYDINSYETLLNMCEKHGLNIPITPGIMPITNYTQLKRFSDMCGAIIPRPIAKKLEAYAKAKDTTSLEVYGTEIVTELCQKLIELGVPGLHFYCLNHHKAVTNILEQL